MRLVYSENAVADLVRLRALQQSSFPILRIFVYSQKWAALLNLLRLPRLFAMQFSGNT